MIKMKCILILFLLSLMNGNVAQTQWIQTNGPDGGKINCFVAIGTNNFAGTGGGGVFLSKNYGANWTSTGLKNVWVSALLARGTNLFAGTEQGLFLLN